MIAAQEMGASAAPGADRAAIHMHEVRAGIFADAASVTGHGSAVDLADGTGAKPKIGSLTLNVQGVAGDATGGFAQHRVGLLSAIAGKKHEGFVDIKE